MMGLDFGGVVFFFFAACRPKAGPPPLGLGNGHQGAGSWPVTRGSARRVAGAGSPARWPEGGSRREATRSSSSNPIFLSRLHHLFHMRHPSADKPQHPTIISPRLHTSTPYILLSYFFFLAGHGSCLPHLLTFECGAALTRSIFCRQTSDALLRIGISTLNRPCGQPDPGKTDAPR